MMLRGEELRIWLKVEIRVCLSVTPSSPSIKIALSTAGREFASEEVLGLGVFYCVCVCGVCMCNFGPHSFKRAHTYLWKRGVQRLRVQGFSSPMCLFGQTPFVFPSQKLVLPQVHPLDDVSTVVEDATDVFRVNGAGEVGVTVVPPVPACCADPQEFISNEVLCSCNTWIFSRLWCRIVRCGVASKFRKVFLDFGLPCQHFLC